MDLNSKIVGPYGDTTGDGAIQLSFTLPLNNDSIATQAAKKLLLKMGFKDIQIVHQTLIGEKFTFFVVYGKTTLTVNTEFIKPLEVNTKVMERKESDQMISTYFNRKLVVVGACIGEDAHTVGIDAIMNMKGYDGHYGLERYSMFETYNLGAQVQPSELLEKSMEVEADAILISQVVTQRDIHLRNLTRMVELVEASGIRNKVVMVAGGPRIDNSIAVELGYDACFGRGSFAEDVATFIIEELHRRQQEV
ncbi:MAG: cobalamin-dependent protein [Deltaproteobacteria bacterium]|jgi:beta-lysine 5,6-aminomutase beta subunit|nr:cobalamin-dependent protein [Deltaproteobacteria bacterium]